MEPRFSVIIPSYNRAATLGRAIKSIINQNFPTKEIIVVDDGSTDHTQMEIKSFPQVTYFYQENRGVSAARNQGAKIAIGDWLIFLDSDDELLPNALENYSNALADNPLSSILLGGYILNKNGKETLLIPEKGKFIGYLSGSFAIKKELFDRLKGYDTYLKFAENTELFFRIEQSNAFIGEVHFPILRYNQHDQGGNTNLKETTKGILYILKKHPQISDQVKRLYHQILGVNYLRFRQFQEARIQFKKAYLLNPLKLDTLGRLVIAMIPFLAKRLYSPFNQNK